MNTIELILGAAMTAFTLINFFVKSWAICIAIVLFAVGCIYSMPEPVNPFLMSGVAIIGIGQLVALMIAKHNNP
jgi:hypothetical protein